VSELPTIDEALALVLERVRALPAEEVAVGDAFGRCVVEDARAALDLPPFDCSAMDGYAVRAADTPGSLRVAGESAAGRPAGRALEPGEAFGISTGAAVPEGADAVVPVELTTRRQEVVEVQKVELGQHVRPRGGDVHAEDVVVATGTLLGAVQVGALASAGLRRVRCGRVPRVAILATGTELRRPGERLEPGQIYESNSVLLASAVRSAGAEATVLDAVADDERATRAALESGLDADVLLTSGGVSVGEHDLVRAGLADLGATEVFWRMAVKPGKPIAFATRGDTLVFGLPGNPVSSLVGFELLVRPALLALQGVRDPAPSYLPGVLGATLRRNESRDELVRARFDDGVLHVITGQESHMIGRAAAANALVLVARGDGELRQGEQVRWLRL
jgi:molybdopterin molybdotransferase